MAPAVEHALDRAAREAGFARSPADLDEVLHWDGLARRAAAEWQGAA